tara:strand:+ start:72 stop:344 length:273 start_codon:yes stop_codon:yes gene_type:complete
MLIILLICVIIFLFVLLFYSFRRINQYEDIIENVSNIIEYTDERLKVIDNKGSFEADDEIGFFFQEVKKLQEILNELFEIEEEDVDIEKS